MTQHHPAETILHLPDQFASYIDVAIVRLAYLYPEMNFSRVGICGVNVSGSCQDWASIKKEITYVVYREKIYSETLPLRSKIMRG